MGLTVRSPRIYLHGLLVRVCNVLLLISKITGAEERGWHVCFFLDESLCHAFVGMRSDSVDMKANIVGHASRFICLRRQSIEMWAPATKTDTWEMARRPWLTN